jgi:hypothetical protein
MAYYEFMNFLGAWWALMLAGLLILVSALIGVPHVNEVNCRAAHRAFRHDSARVAAAVASGDTNEDKYQEDMLAVIRDAAKCFPSDYVVVANSVK